MHSIISLSSPSAVPYSMSDDSSATCSPAGANNPSH